MLKFALWGRRIAVLEGIIGIAALFRIFCLKCSYPIPSVSHLLSNLSVRGLYVCPAAWWCICPFWIPVTSFISIPHLSPPIHPVSKSPVFIKPHPLTWYWLHGSFSCGKINVIGCCISILIVACHILHIISVNIRLLLCCVKDDAFRLGQRHVRCNGHTKGNDHYALNWWEMDGFGQLTCYSFDSPINLIYSYWVRSMNKKILIKVILKILIT